jgi:hypothetical protein
MVTKGLTSDHMKYCELRSCAKGGGGCYLAKGSESASLPGPAAQQLSWEKHCRQVNSLRCARHEW